MRGSRPRGLIGIGQGHPKDPGASNPPASLAAISPFTGAVGDTAHPQVVPPGGGVLRFLPADLPQAAAPGRAADTATVLLAATDEIPGTHSDRACQAEDIRPLAGPPLVCPIVEAEMIKMSVLVVYASKHGATRGIAGRIAASLRTAGCKTDVRPVKDAGDLAAYDAFVIGSAAYELNLRKEATEFVRRNRKVLAARPVWLFSSGPLGTEPADAKGRTCAR